MTITISKFKLALGVVAVALLGAGTAAMASHTFTDVPDGAFYTEPVEWLADNGLTTGSPSGSDTFKPLDNVTRGEYATFNYRYDQNIVQPALDDIRDDIDDLEETQSMIYTAQIESDCDVRSQSEGMTITARGGLDYICDVEFDTDIDSCTAHAQASLYGDDLGWALVGLSYAVSPPQLWTQLTDTDTMAIHQYTSGDADTDPATASSIWFDLTVICVDQESELIITLGEYDEEG